MERFRGILSRKFTCPYCIREYNASEILHECPDCGNTSVPTAFERTRVKCKTPGCHGLAARLKCPKCGREIPKTALETTNLPFSIIGVSESGKSNYITVMLEELKKRGHDFNLVLGHQTEYTRTHQEENYQTIYHKHQPVEATSTKEPPPQIWYVKNLGKQYGRIVPTYSFTIFDGAGEDHETRMDISQAVVRYIRASKAIILTLDPLILSGVRERGIVDETKMKNSLVGSLGREKSAVDIVNNLAAYIKSARGIRVEQLLDVPVAVVLTKFDLILSGNTIPQDKLIHRPSLSRVSGTLYMSELQQIDQEIRYWLHTIGEAAFIRTLEAHFQEISFFGVSSYGKPPIGAKSWTRSSHPIVYWIQFCGFSINLRLLTDRKEQRDVIRTNLHAMQTWIGFAAETPISSDGFKVFSCSPEILDGNVADLPLLADAMQTKQSYSDPAFMDDAYLYYTPENGNRFLVNFHPIPFQTDTPGNYAHRPGNFVNHAFLGKFTEDYPYEWFRDDRFWTAKAKPEAYYYESPPTPLPPRIHQEPVPRIQDAEILAFVADGRSDALMAAVSFLIAQFGMEPENRKYLAIRDESSAKLELWIAAIERAFSPRMSSAIPFATRMDQFINRNRYAINADGMYQMHINLQDPNQRQRYHAMIVGVDEHDSANASTARPLPNSQFALLNGLEKRACFQADTQNPYFRLITQYNEEHRTFCRKFLQMLDIASPCPELFSLYGVFAVLNQPVLPNARILSDALRILRRFGLVNTPALLAIHNRIYQETTRFLNENLMSALEIIRWLRTASAVIGLRNDDHSLPETVCRMCVDHIYRLYDSEEIRHLWDYLKPGEFARDVALAVTDAGTIRANLPLIQQAAPDKAATLVSLCLECASLVGRPDLPEIQEITLAGMKTCCTHRNGMPSKLS